MDAPAKKAPTDLPPGLIAVPLGKACVLLLTEPEYLAGIRRGNGRDGGRRGNCGGPRSTMSPKEASKLMDTLVISITSADAEVTRENPLELS